MDETMSRIYYTIDAVSYYNPTRGLTALCISALRYKNNLTNIFS